MMDYGGQNYVPKLTSTKNVLTKNVLRNKITHTKFYI